MTLDAKSVTFYPGLDAHCRKHVHDSLAPVALLVGETSDSGDLAGPLAEGGEDRDYREEVRTVAGVHFEGLQRGFLDMDYAGLFLN